MNGRTIGGMIIGVLVLNACGSDGGGDAVAGEVSVAAGDIADELDDPGADTEEAADELAAEVEDAADAEMIALTL